ncbi:MAG: T9SS type A sorting domain-containing protein, partial [Crocinitomicaceae bacterium]
IDDGSSGGVTLFGANPPACGVQLLNHNLGAAGYYNNSGGLLGDPNSDLKYWSNMNGNWADGTSFTEGGNGYGGAVPTNYIYDGNPNDSTVFADEYPSDRRAFLASEPIDDFMPGDYICYDFAVLYSRTGGNAFLNVNGLFDVADSAQLFYDAQPFYYCDPLLLGESEIYRHTNDFMIYPNPAQNEFKISVEGYFSIDIYDMTGKLIISKTGLNTGEFISAPKTAGIYLINIHNQQFSYSNKLVVE